jgi:hypothetical protein
VQFGCARTGRTRPNRKNTPEQEEHARGILHKIPVDDLLRKRAVYAGVGEAELLERMKMRMMVCSGCRKTVCGQLTDYPLYLQASYSRLADRSSTKATGMGIRHTAIRDEVNNSAFIRPARGPCCSLADASPDTFSLCADARSDFVFASNCSCECRCLYYPGSHNYSHIASVCRSSSVFTSQTGWAAQTS